MTNGCFDIGTIQGFLDGELAVEKTEAVARHISVCDDCAILLAIAEEETSFAFSALEPELNALVPTQRLWAKISDSIEQEKQSFWKPIFAFLLKPSTAAFAGLLFVAVVSITLLTLRPDAPTNFTAQTIIEKPTVSQTVQQIEQTPIVDIPQIRTTEKIAEKTIETISFTPNKNEVRAMKANYVKPENKRTVTITPPTKTDAVNPIPNGNLLGEESYVKTIATLTATVNSRKDEALSPSARFDFERDLAMTDDAIKQMRKEVQKNPSNEAARRILRSSYQNKIDLLNSVADKTELMASLK